MDRFEIFTIGGGRYLFNFFNAMAAIAQSDAYAAVITSAVMIGGIWISARIVINQQTGAWQGLPRHMLLVVCLLYGALYPKATVKITDTIDPVNSGGYIVANVPWGPAFLTSIFTMASHEITTLLENNLSMPTPQNTPVTAWCSAPPCSPTQPASRSAIRASPPRWEASSGAASITTSCMGANPWTI